MANYRELNRKNYYELAMKSDEFLAWVLAGNPIYTYSINVVGLGGCATLTPRTIQPEEIKQKVQRAFEISRNSPPLAIIGKYYTQHACADGSRRLMYVGKSPEHLKALTWFIDLVSASRRGDFEKISKLREQFMEIQKCLAKEGFIYIENEN